LKRSSLRVEGHDLFHGDRRLVRPHPLLEPGALQEPHAEPDALADDDDVGKQVALSPGGDADHPAVAEDEALDHRFVDDEGTRRLGLGREPRVEAGPEHRPRVGVVAVAKVLVAEQPERGLVGHEPPLLLDHRALDGRLLPCVADDLLQVVAVEDAAHHVLGAGLLPLFEDDDLQPRLGHRDRGRDAGRAGPDDDGVKLLVLHSLENPIDSGWN
jgi:hypothetical protein